jgi:hypothetical protein
MVSALPANFLRQLSLRECQVLWIGFLLSDMRDGHLVADLGWS